MAKIQVLDREVAELIAAGEVVERPASVIKELVENAVDAGADAITVEIRNGGVTYMRVSDNGSGMSKEELPHAFLRHATSKIATKEDLYHIGTMGFRGEALAAISAVAKIEVLTRTEAETAGTRLLLEGGQVCHSEDAGCPKGTTMIVKDLFYNTPARLKFLKKDATEGAQISSLIDMLALANAHIAFTYIRDGKRVLSTSGDGRMQNAAYAVLGKNIAANLIPVSYQYENITVEGYTGKPMLARPNRKMEILFLNGRYLRSHIYTAALEAAYKNSITIGKYPVSLIRISLPCEMVDINVHPAKMEAKFSAERTVFDAVFFALKHALSTYQAREQVILPDGGQAASAAGGKLVSPDKEGDKSLFSAHAGTTDRQEADVPGPAGKPPADDAHRADELISGLIAQDKQSGIPYQKERKEPTDLLHDVLDNPLFRGAAHQPAAHLSRAARRDTSQTAPPDALAFAQDDSLYQVTYQSRADAYGTRKHTTAAEEKGTVRAQSAPAGMACDQADGPSPAASDRATPEKISSAGEDSARMGVSSDKQEAALPADRGAFAIEKTAPAEEMLLPGYEKQEMVRIVGEVFQTYIILEAGDQMLLIDKHAAHERMLYEKLRASGQVPDAQVLLDPVVVDLTKDEFALVFEQIELIEKTGFHPEEFGASSVVLREVPTLLDHRDVGAAFIQMLDALAAYRNESDFQILDRIFYSMACRAAVKAGDAVDEREITALAREWIENGNIKYCPHGRPVCLNMDQKYLEKQFKRIQ